MPDQIRHSRELVLRLPCPACRNGLHIPVAMFVQATDMKCPKCSAEVAPGVLDLSLPGVQEVLDAAGRIELACPQCQRDLQASIRHAGQEKQCPHCRTLIELRFVSVKRPDATWQSAATPNAAPVETQQSSVIDQPRPPKSKPVPAPTQQPRPPAGNSGNGRKPAPVATASRGDEMDEVLRQAPRVAERPAGDPSPRRREPDEPQTRHVPRFIDSNSEQDEPVMYESRTSNRSSPSRGGGFFVLPPRSTAWCIWILIMIAAGFTIASAASANIPALAFAALLFFIPRLSLATRITNLILPHLIHSVRCPGCEEDIEAVGRWTIGDYTDHRDRHILRVRHPRDGSCIGQTNCPRCGSTILIR